MSYVVIYYDILIYSHFINLGPIFSCQDLSSTPQSFHEKWPGPNHRDHRAGPRSKRSKRRSGEAPQPRWRRRCFPSRLGWGQCRVRRSHRPPGLDGLDGLVWHLDVGLKHGVPKKKPEKMRENWDLTANKWGFLVGFVWFMLSWLICRSVDSNGFYGLWIDISN